MTGGFGINSAALHICEWQPMKQFKFRLENWTWN